jgi:hypothetical protein
MRSLRWSVGVATLWAVVLLVACKSDPPGAEPLPAPPMPAPPIPAGPKLVFVPAPEGDVAALVRAERDRARAEKKQLLVYVGAGWCEPCRRFHEAATSGTLDARLPAIRFVEFDLERDEDRLKDAGYTTQYIPLFAAPLPDGRASGKQIAGSIKGPGAPDEITPRLLSLLAEATGS